MKRLFSVEAYKLIFWGCLLPSLTWILFYELSWSEKSSASFEIYKIGIIASHIFYSILATSIFYFVSQYIPVYLPRQRKKIKILYNVYQKTIIINAIIGDLKHYLGVSGNDFQKSKDFGKLLQNIDPDKPVKQFQTWHVYLWHLRNKLLSILGTITIYNDYLSKDFLQELIIFEKQLLSPNTFEGFKTIDVSDLSYAELTLQELLVHNKHLQELREKEFKKYEKQFEEDGVRYRETFYKDIDKQEGIT